MVIEILPALAVIGVVNEQTKKLDPKRKKKKNKKNNKLKGLL